MVYGIVLTTLMDIDCRRSELPWSREAQQATVENNNNFHRIDIWGFPKMVGNPPKEMVIVIIINGKNHGLGYPYVRKPPFNHSSERPEIWPEGHPVIPFRCLLMQLSMDPLVQEPWTHGCQQFLWVHSCIHGLPQPTLHDLHDHAWRKYHEQIQKKLKHCCMAASWKTFGHDTKNIKQPLVMDQAMATAIQKSQLIKT